MDGNNTVYYVWNCLVFNKGLLRLKALYKTFDYKDSTNINISLYDTILKNLKGKSVVGGGIMTSHWNLHKRGLKDVNTICDWINTNTPIAASCFSQGKEQDNSDLVRNFTSTSFDLSSCWAIHYTNNTHIVQHNHFPFAISFVYSVRAPEGSSPLLIEEHKINLPEGTVVFFPANQYHGTIPTDTIGRCMLVGNISYKFWEWQGE